MAKGTWCAATEQVDFHLANGIAATAGFNGGDISGFGGAVLLALIDDAYKFTETAARCIKDKRDPQRVTHSMTQLLRQAVLLCGLGYPSGIDWSRFHADPMLRMCLGWQPDGDQNAASQASNSRFKTARTERDLLRLFSHSIKFYIEKHEKPPEIIELDPDGSAIEAHGRQQFIAFNGHYEMNMFFPLFIRDQHNYLLAAVLRPGNFADTEMALPILKMLIKRFRRAWPKVKILVRGDAAFHDPQIMDWCEQNNVDFVLALKSDNALNVGSKQFDTEAQREFTRLYGEPWFNNQNGSKQKHALLREISAQPKTDRRAAYAILDERHVRQTGKFQHRAGEGGNDKKRLERRWKRERTVVSVARCTDRALKRRYLVVSDSLSAYTPDVIYDEIYSARGSAELVIRSLKALGAARLNNQEALTNQFQLIIYQMTHNLLRLLMETLPQALKHLSIDTIIREIIRIPVQVKVSTRKIWLRWTSSYKYKELVIKLSKRLNVLPKAA